MRIGTPLAPSAPRATRFTLLGSGKRGEEVIIALQRLGVDSEAIEDTSMVSLSAKTRTHLDPTGVPLRLHHCVARNRCPNSPRC